MEIMFERVEKAAEEVRVERSPDAPAELIETLNVARSVIELAKVAAELVAEDNEGGKDINNKLLDCADAQMAVAELWLSVLDFRQKGDEKGASIQTHRCASTGFVLLTTILLGHLPFPFCRSAFNEAIESKPGNHELENCICRLIAVRSSRAEARHGAARKV